MGPSGFRAAFLPQRSCACNFHDPRPTHSRGKCCAKKWSAVCFTHYSLFSEEENNYENVTTDRSRKFDRWRLPDVGESGQCGVSRRTFPPQRPCEYRAQRESTSSPQ